LGRCVATGRFVCAECSTRLNGINYSPEGLALLRRRREAANRPDGGRSRTWGLAGLAFWPAGFLAMAGSYWAWLRLAGFLLWHFRHVS